MFRKWIVLCFFPREYRSILANCLFFAALSTRIALLLAGSLPQELGNLAALKKLDVSYNQLSGESLGFRIENSA